MSVRKKARELVFDDIGHWIFFRVADEAFVHGVLHHFRVTERGNKPPLVSIRVDGIEAPSHFEYMGFGQEQYFHVNANDIIVLSQEGPKI